MVTNETVSKTKVLETTKEVEQVETPRKTVTNWRVLEKAGFIPVRIKCDGYRSSHPADLSCHSNLTPSAENVLRHMDTSHGGGWFKIRFRLSDSKTSPLWRALEDAGVELQEFYCPHCREIIPMTPRTIVYHLNPHPGANRVNLAPQTLCMSLGFQRSEQDEMVDLYMD